MNNKRPAAADAAEPVTKRPNTILLTPELRETLDRDGAVIVPGVLPLDVCQEVYREMLEYHRLWNPVLVPEHPEAWTGKLKPPGPHGLNQFDGHQSFCWTVRQHPRVAQVFAELFHEKPENLLVSFDGFRFVIRGRHYRSNTWGHTDQNPQLHDHPFQCVQASVCVTPSTGDDDGDFVFWRGSHRAHRGYFLAHPGAVKNKDNWYKFPEEYFEEIQCDGSRYLRPEDHVPSEPGSPVPMPRVRIRRQTGDMVLWYSTTTHQSQPPGPGAQHDATAVFVCMAPRKYLNPKRGSLELKRRLKAFEERRTTCHWPVIGFKMFQKIPFRSDLEHFNRGKQGVRDLPEPSLTPLGRRLVGYES